MTLVLSEINDLCVWLDMKLETINYAIKRLQMSDFILRVSNEFHNIDTIKTLCTSV